MREAVDRISDVATLICWGAFALVWLGGAIVTRRNGPPVRQREPRDVRSLLAILTVIVGTSTPASVWDAFLVGWPWLRLAGVALLAVATPVALWARLVLGTMWSAAVVAKQDHELRTDGPYRFTRHPIYTAILAMIAGTALSQGIGRWAFIFVGVTVVVLLKTRAEERLLRRKFPDEYSRYQQQVPQLVPLPRPYRRRIVRRIVRPHDVA